MKWSALIVVLAACGSGGVGGGTGGSGGGASSGGGAGGGVAAGGGSGGGSAAGGGSAGGSGGGSAAGGGSGGGSAGGSGGGSGGGSASGGGSGGGSAAGGGAGGAAMRCAPLPAPTGTIVNVMPSQAAMLPTIVGNAAAGTTFVLADGTYAIPGTGVTLKANQTLRSASGNPAAVILDGAYTTNEILRVTANDVTVAEVTVTRAVDHPIHVYPPNATTGIARMKFYRVRFIDNGEQFLKANSASTSAYTDDGVVECSHFEMTNAGRPMVERTPGGCYTGGIDVHGGRGWIVRWNTFKDIYCAGEGLAEHAVHFWTGSRDTLVENNVILNCARGVGFGLGDATAGRTYADNPYPGVLNVGHYDGIIRNNFIWADINYFDTGIGLEQSRGTKVIHNTVVSTAGTQFFSSIDTRFAATQAVVRNNLTRRITNRDNATATADHNLEMAPNALFAGFATGNLHLVSGAGAAINQGIADPAAGVDIDGLGHDAGVPDLGAHEYR